MSHPSSAPLISVVMPAYNASRYLGEAIESILGQTLSDFELIVIDDGSTDETPRILQTFAERDPRVRVIRIQNSGIGSALNTGLAATRGSFIARMDGDDISLPTRFEKQVAYLRAHPECVLVGTRVLQIDPEGDPLFEMDTVEPSHERIDQLLLEGRWAIVHPAIMIPRAVMETIGGYDNDLVPVEDHDMFLRLGEIGRLANLPEVLFKYRKHPQNSVRVMADRRVKALTTAIENAFARRGITDRSRFPEILPDVDRDDPRREVKQQRNWGWDCLKYGSVATARKYAFRSVRGAPLDWESWKLLCCSLRGY
jgi:glycosyltransferase involved in cell wall biosynthesis